MFLGDKMSRLVVYIVVAWLAIATAIPLVMAQGINDSNETSEILLGGIVEVNKTTIATITLEQALELAYTIRNLTYDLFQWEIQHNVTAAKIQLQIGDRFLERALNLSSTAPRRAIVFALVASIHYGHAAPIANVVLGRVIDSNLGENNEVTADTVNAVLNTASELKSILLNAIDYAKSKGYNTTLPENILARGDNRYTLSQQALAEGNITLAFRLAVSAYRTYVRAYATLIQTVRAQFMSRVGIRPGSLLVPREQALRKVVEILPVPVREMIRDKIESRNIREIVAVIKERARSIREEIQAREKENLKIMIREIIQRIREKRGININQTDIERLIEENYQKGHRGLELARRVISELENIAREKMINRVIPTVPSPRR